MSIACKQRKQAEHTTRVSDAHVAHPACPLHRGHKKQGSPDMTAKLWTQIKRNMISEWLDKHRKRTLVELEP